MNEQSERLDQHYVDVSQLNAMALACRARDVIQLKTLDQVLATLTRLKQDNTPFVILSGGTNIVLPPVLNATLLIPALQGQVIHAQTDDEVIVEVMAGQAWHELVVETVNKGWYGLENLALIPSWVGASPVQNIGAYGVQVQDVIVSVTALHIPTLTIKTLTNEACEFGYRDSIFKRQMGDWLITSVTFRLHKNPSVNTQYGDVARVAQDYATKAGRDVITPVDTLQAIIQIRESKLPDVKQLPNCGSFFQNPIVDKAKAEQLLQQFPSMVQYPVKDAHSNITETVKLAAGWLIEQAGLKGGGIAPILTHVHQALVLTNHAPYVATQTEVEATMRLIQDTVYQKFAITLSPEPVWIEANGSIRQFH